jgi:hypothetical protein
MALSGNFTGATSNQYIQPKITWSAVQSVSGNYSDVTATLTYSRTNSGYTTSGKWVGSITINGITTSGSSGESQIYITQNSNTFAMSATTRVYHNNDGTKSITISAAGSLSAGSLTSTSISGTIILSTIPRAGELDSLTCNTNYLDGTFTYKYTPKSSSFYHQLRVSIPNVVALGYVRLGTKPTSQQTGTYTLSATLLESIYNSYPSASTCTIGFVIETYSDSGYTAKIGESVELNVPSLNFPDSVRPSIGGISWAKTSGEPAGWGMTQNVSEGTLTMTNVSGIYGSTIKSYSLTFAGYSSTTSSLSVPNIASSGKLKAIAKVTDTRERSATKEVEFTVTAYAKPQLSVVAYRSDSSGNEDTSGEYLYLKATVSVTTVGTNALKTLVLGYKRHDSASYTHHVALTNGVAEITAMGSDYTWDWGVTATDEVNTVTVNGSISTGEVVLDILANGKGIGLGKVAEKEGLDSAWPFKLNGIQLDYIVEQGTSGSWTYRKWASGTAECWAVFTKTFIGDNNGGGASSVWNSNAVYVDDYPFTFTSVPAVSFNLEDAGVNSWGMKMASNVNNVGLIYALTGVKISSINPNGLTCTISLIAKGRWK